MNEWLDRYAELDLEAWTFAEGLDPSVFLRMQGTAYLPYAGLKLAWLADCVASGSEKNPKRVYCTVAFGEGTREPLKIPVKSCNRPWTSHFAYLGNWDVSQGGVATSGLVGF